MTPNDQTQPLLRQPAPAAAWRAYPTSAESRRPPTGIRPAWVVLAFVVGAALMGILAAALLAPAPAPNAPAQTSGAALKVTLTDTLLTTALNDSHGTASLTLTQARAHIQASGAITISGVLQGAPIADGSVVTVVAQPYVSQNTLAVKVLRASVAGLALPTATLNALRDQINAQLAQSSHVSLGVGQGLVVSGVSFSDGAMTLSYAPAGA